MADRILVTGGYARKCLAVVTSLGRRGVEVTVGNVDRWGPPLWSRWKSRRFVYPDPGAEPERFLDAIAKEVARGGHSLIFPTGGADTALLARHRDRFPVPVAAPPFALIDLANDKEALLRKAEAAGVPIPKTHFDAEDRVAEIAREARWPLLVRPNRGSGGRGLVRVERAEELAPAIARVAAAFGRVLVQEFVPSAQKGYGCSGVVGLDGKVAALFCHRRLREYPVGGGPATLVESVHDPALVSQAERLLAALNWTSVAMTEWRRDERDGVFRLIEINPRMWGSSHLALDAGVDIPWLLAEVHRGRPVARVTDYRAGVRRRWLLPTDLLHWLKNPARGAMDPPFFRILERNTRYDFMELADPLPAAMNVLSLARMALTGRAKGHVDRSA